MYVRMLQRELKNRPRKLRPVCRCFLSTFAASSARTARLQVRLKRKNCDNGVFCEDASKGAKKIDLEN